MKDRQVKDRERGKYTKPNTQITVTYQYSKNEENGMVKKGIDLVLQDVDC